VLWIIKGREDKSFGGKTVHDVALLQYCSRKNREITIIAMSFNLADFRFNYKINMAQCTFQVSSEK
jgi:hypothetical protein